MQPRQAEKHLVAQHMLNFCSAKSSYVGYYSLIASWNAANLALSTCFLLSDLLFCRWFLLLESFCVNSRTKIPGDQCCHQTLSPPGTKITFPPILIFFCIVLLPHDVQMFLIIQTMSVVPLHSPFVHVNDSLLKLQINF